MTHILKYGVCLWTLYDVYVVCESLVDDIVYVMINILYVNI
jgi:hypothetical protein